MAAYGALVSLSHIIHQILHPPPLNSILIDRELVELLYDKVYRCIYFLETYSGRCSEEIEDLERRIRDAAYEAEDIIESNVMDQIHASDREELRTLLCEGIHKVLERFRTVEEELLTIRVVQSVRCLQLVSSATATSSRSFTDRKITLVGFDKHLIRIMGALDNGEPGRQIIPIVGMGGLGKTTLARAVYDNRFIVESFHVRAWVTVSQEYTIQELLRALLSESDTAGPDKPESISNHELLLSEIDTDGLHKPESISNHELGLQLYKKLFGRKYLIVLDDIWNIQAWEELKIFLPNNENRSRVLVTSRISNLAEDWGSCLPYKIDFLDEEHGWELFCKTVFREEDCPAELEEIGKYIAERCRGLPLALVLIGGLLAKSQMTRDHWEFFAGGMISAWNLGNDDQLMKILSLSYTHLPVCLKPCFLYFAMFPEDFTIYASTLVKLWVAEGLIKPIQGKCLEEVAHEFLEELISRNVVLVDKRGSRGNVRSCKLHDLVRDLCITQAEKEKFACIVKLDNPNFSPDIEIQRRLSICSFTKPLEMVLKALRSATLNRSWLSTSVLNVYPTSETEVSEDDMDSVDSSTSEMGVTIIEPSTNDTETSVDDMDLEDSSTSEMGVTIIEPSTNETETSVDDMDSVDSSTISSANKIVDELAEIVKDFRLLKIVHVDPNEFCFDTLSLSNLRYVVANKLSPFSPMALWNLQTLILSRAELHLAPEIWQMPQLRHLKLLFLNALPDPPDDDQNVTVLENLQTIKGVHNFKCSEQVLKRIPNLKKLNATYSKPSFDNEQGKIFCLHNLASFEKLESCRIAYGLYPTTTTFPISLKKLTLSRCDVPWEHFSLVARSLPYLEVVKLLWNSPEGAEWNPNEGQFCRLKYLKIVRGSLEIWGAENDHFPCLERLILNKVKLKEIPMSFSEITTLQTIVLKEVEDSVWKSAMEISKEREQFTDEPLLLERHPF